MGYFSWECKGCHQSLREGERVYLDGCKGVYDGFGRAGAYDFASGGDGDPAAWHYRCFHEAPQERQLDRTPSKHASDQGCGFPRQDCMPLTDTIREPYREPPRLPYADVTWAEVFTYLASMEVADQIEKGPCLVLRPMGPGEWPIYRTESETPDHSDVGKRTRGIGVLDVTKEHFHAAKLLYGKRFEHDYLKPLEEEWEELQKDKVHLERREIFGGRMDAVSRVALRTLWVTANFETDKLTEAMREAISESFEDGPSTRIGFETDSYQRTSDTFAFDESGEEVFLFER